MRRAHHPEQKEVRRQAILERAAALLQASSFHAFRMADLADAVGLAKGTLYLYFPTKESLVLDLLQGRIQAWFRRTTAALASLPVDAPATEVAHAFTSSLLGDPGLVDWLALLHGVLEQNVASEQIAAFKRQMLAEMGKVAALVEARVPGLGPGQGAAVFLRFYALVIGVHALEPRAPAVLEALRQPDLAVFHIPFQPTLEALFTDLLVGMARR